MIPRLTLLFEEVGLPRLEIPAALAAAYGGDFGLPERCVVANFVESADGVVALKDAGAESGGMVSGGSAADRLLMGLLRACADAVLIGAGTLRAAPKDLWFPDSIFPAAAPLYAELRAGLGLAPRPALYVISGSRKLDPAHPALVQGGVVITRQGGPGPVEPAEILATVRAGGHRRILCEGGPGLFGELAKARLVDELFLTLSPRLFGRYDGDGRKALTDKVDLGAVPLRLLSARREGSHLFLRYALERFNAGGGGARR